ncbi:MAG: hypothetical protein IPH75_02450 [bacterium]|nr:hypothetical protein [bacterium]
MNIFEKMMSIDRRWVFLLLAVVVIGTYAVSFEIPIRVNSEVRNIYEFIDKLQPGEIVYLGVDYDPSNQAELHPMAYAVMEHCFRKKLKIIFCTLSQYGPGMVDGAIKDITDSMRVEKTYHGVTYPGRELVNGEDYVFLGYKAYFALQILAMGQNFRLPFPVDYYGRPLDERPMMKGVMNYKQVACVVALSGGNITEAWISYGQGRFNFPLALGTTGVMAADYYPYLNSGQVFGLMGGLLGAAQYEKLSDNPGPAIDGMRVQVFAHIVIIVFIIIGNIGYFTERRRRAKEGR